MAKAMMIPQGREAREKVLIYAGAVLLLVLLAVASFALTARGGSQAQQCMHILLQGNRYGCLEQLALSTDNATLCAGLQPSSIAESCYSTVAENTGDPATCAGINNTAGIAACVTFIANASGVGSYCGDIQGSASGPCYAQVAVKEYNASLCTNIPSSIGRSACNASVGLREALLLQSGASCLQVSDASNAILDGMALDNVSQYLQSRVKTGATSVSGYAAAQPTQSLSPRDACYILLAFQSENTSYCSSVANSNLANYCTGTVEGFAGNVGAAPVNYSALLADCQTAESQYQGACRSSIILEEAVSNREPGLCVELNSSYTQNQCYTALAVRYRDVSYCASIVNQTADQACVMDISFYNTTSNTPSNT